MLDIAKTFTTKAEYIKEFGKFDLGPQWKVEQTEFVDIEQAGGYQTADDTNEDIYPEPTSRIRLSIEQPNVSIEETYYWFLHFMRQELGFPQIEKIYDIFSASEASAIFGQMGQRLSIQQDRVSQYLTNVGGLVKQLFSLVRELRIIDEKLTPHREWKRRKSADITLKHTFISLVEGGGNNPDSIYSLSQRVGFTVLPDLFFGTHVYSIEDIDNEVDKGSMKEFNKVVKTVLKRKLFQYVVWKEKIEKELEARRRFQLQYTRQHWTVIQMYIAWVKPYLKAVKRMQQHQGFMDSPDIINAFDTTKLEIQILGKKPVNIGKKDGHYSCVLATFTYSTKPKLTYNQQYGQQAVAHTGKVKVTLRSYGWHDEDIKAYKLMRQQEDIAMLKSLDVHLASTFDALGKDFEKYLEEAEDEDALKRKEKRDEEAAKVEQDAKNAYNQHNKFHKLGPLEPFFEMGAGIGELFGSFFKGTKQKKSSKKVAKPNMRNENMLKKAAGKASIEMNVLYTVYKKTHRHLAW